jgi:hypothetical protein
MEKKTTNTNLSIREKVIYSLIGIGILGGGIFYGRKFVQKGISNREENKSFEDGTPATIAKQIKMAFENDGWPGTDVVKLRSSLTEIPSKEVFLKVQESYKKLFNGNLIADMSDELQSTEYNEMMQIIAAKPPKKGAKISNPNIQYTGWAKRLKAAFDKVYGFLPGTDGDAITAVLSEIPSQKAFINTGIVYKKLYGANVMNVLKSEGEFGQYTEWMKVITSKPKG